MVSTVPSQDSAHRHHHQSKRQHVFRTVYRIVGRLVAFELCLPQKKGRNRKEEHSLLAPELPSWFQVPCAAHTPSTCITPALTTHCECAPATDWKLGSSHG